MSSNDTTYETIAITTALVLLLSGAAWLILTVGKRVEDGLLAYMESTPAPAVGIERQQPVHALPAVATNSAAGASHDTFEDRFGNSIKLPKAVPGRGSTPEQKLHGHWIWVSSAFTDDSGTKKVNGPWPMEEDLGTGTAEHLYIDSKSDKKKMSYLQYDGSIVESYFSVSSQNVKTGVIKIEYWGVKDDEKPVSQRGAGKRQYTLNADGTLTFERMIMGAPHTQTLRRIGDEIAP